MDQLEMLWEYQKEDIAVDKLKNDIKHTNGKVEYYFFNDPADRFHWLRADRSTADDPFFLSRSQTWAVIS